MPLSETEAVAGVVPVTLTDPGLIVTTGRTPEVLVTVEEKVTVPVKPLTGATVIVAVGMLVAPAAALRVGVVVLTVKVGQEPAVTLTVSGETSTEPVDGLIG
jgi:hypothetical protein